MAYDGSSSACVRSTARSLPASFQTAHSASAFVKASTAPSTSSGYDVVIGYCGGSGQNPQGNLHWDHQAGGLFYKSWNRRASNNGYYPAQLASTPPLNTWFHLAVTYDGSVSRIYLDGVLDGTSAAFGPGNSSDAYTSLMGAVTSGGGYDNAPTSFPTGQVAEVGFWDTVLTDDEIVSLAKGFRPSRVRPDKLQTYFPAVRRLLELKKGGASLIWGTLVVSDHPRVFG